MAKGYKYLTPKEYDKIRKFHELGLTTKQIRELTGRSAFTIAGAKRFETLEEYREWNRNMKNKTRKEKRQAKVKAQSGEQLAIPNLDELTKLGEDVMEYLKSISKAMSATNEALGSYADKTTKIMEMQQEMIKQLNDRLYVLEKDKEIQNENMEQPF